MVELSQYVLEPLREDQEFILYRGQHRSQAHAPSVLLLAPVSTRPAPESLNRMEREYSFRAELDPAWAVRPLTLSQHNGKTMLVLENPGGEPLHRLIQGPMEMTQFLRLAVGLAAALSQLHKRGLIHKDVKPPNVLVNSATGQVWLMGFGTASRLPRERQSPEPPEFIAGTLPYMAPEQTGRMNRSIDSRSDLYSLGVTLYEMLTGSLPFTASDPMEWVHCHIARQPEPPGERLKNVPGSVSAIIMKLLAKTAEERYQTAAGAESDLRRCLAEWETQCRIDEFPLGEHDTPDRLLVPEKLYGRAREIDTLLASFDRVVASGTPELVLVSGYSGIGKSSVVNELHKVLVPPRGLFASGKFDQYKRDIPYATLAQAFQSLIRPLLSKSEAELSNWRDALCEALGPNGLLIVDLVPELKLIIGEQPLVPDLPPQDAQGRFQLVLRRFIGVFARPEHPLALFLDDLQWLDAATLDLLEHLLTQADVQHLMLIGAYRDNEVSSAHPLTRKLRAIRQAGAIVQEIILAPLACQDLGRLIADSLHCEPELATPLAQLVHDKTAGNPFFAIQFIYALAEESLLTFDHGDARWSWDLNRIHAKGYTDNVVDLMIGKLNRLPVETQKALQQLACLGNITGITTLSIVHGTSEEEIHSDLWEAVRLELIVRLEGSYKFVHDRVQEAAYSLIPEQLRAEAHLRIGRLLTAHTPPEKREEVIFEIVNQVNRGATLITSRDEREQLAELNLIAGKRAKASTAYTSALKHLIAGAALLADDCWERRHELTFLLELHRAECEFLTGELAAAAERLTMLSSRAGNTVELATVACLRVDLYTTLGQSDRAVAVCLEYLRHLGVEWSPHPTEEEARREYERIWSQLGSRAIEELIELPLMSDLASLATLDVLTKVLPSALFTDVNLISLSVCRAVNLSLEHGNSDGSCVAYVWLGKIAGPHFGDYKAGFRFGRLGYELVEQCGLKRFQAGTYVGFAYFVMPWTKHVQAGRDLLRRAFEAANKIGDLTFAAYSCNCLNTNLLAAGDPLVEVEREAQNGLEFAQKARFGLVIDIITAQLGLIRTLRGLTPKFGSFDDGQFDELRFERHLASDPALALPECWYWIRKLQARFSAGDYGAAVDASLRAQRLLWISASLFETAEYHFYSALSHAASCDSAFPDRHRQNFEALAAHHRQLEVWAENCPENFETRAALVGAEIARIQGRELDAERLYEQAIRSAHANGFVHNGALANELAARFYMARGFETIAHAYLRDARYCYLRWGASGKVRQLDELYPHFREQKPVLSPTSTIGALVEHLDLVTVIKVSQAVSSEIVLEKLIDTLMRTAIEHAGAERGLLILPRGVEQRTEAEAMTSGDTVIVRLREGSVTAAALPESIVHYVVRTRESVILDDASAPNPFSADTYIRQHHARSILCLPLINQAKLIGVLYLENNLTPHVFTPTRIAVLKLLASQAAISLENTRLYGDLQEREAKIRRLVDANVIGICIWNLDGQIIDGNEAFLHMVEYGREDLVSGRLRWTDLTPAEWRDRDERAIAEVMATGTVQPFEKEFFRKDGSRVPVLVGAAMFEGSGNEGVAFVLDLSEQKRAEEALRRSEAYLAEAQRLSRTGSFGWSVSSGEIFWSEETFQIFEYDRAYCLPTLQQVLERVHPEDIALVQQITDRASHDGKDFDLEHRLLMRDGSIKYIHVVARAGRSESGELEYVGAVMDVTEHKLAEAALRERERELQQLVDVVPHNIMVFGADWTPLYANRRLRDYFGLTLEDIQASDFRARIYHPDDLDRMRSEREGAMSRGVGWGAEARIRRKDGQYRWFLIRANPLRDEQGRVVRWYSSGTDIEDLKQAEGALRQAQGDLERERDRLKLLLELTNQAVSNLELKDLLRDVSASIRQVMRCDAVGVMLPDPDSNQLRLYAQDCPDCKGFFKEEMGIPLEGSLPGKAFQTGKSVLAGSLELAGLDPMVQSAAVKEGMNSFCLLPLTSRGRVLGVVGLARREESGFSQNDVEFVTQVANQVAIAVDNALAYRQITELKDQLAQEKLYLEDEIRAERGFEEIIGHSEALRTVLHQIETVAPTGSTVLIYGETGTGKELAARAIHNLSPRSTNAFVKLNCAAIPTGLLESELFGHEKGAFTGAIAQRIGRFELAHRGTVFLDEIGEIPLELQPKLLRVLQEREFERLGSARTLRTDARLIAATNRDLAAMVDEQKFRSDLFYRLNVFPVYMPPLRDRQEDIPLLVRHFVQHFAQRMKKTIDSIPSQTMDALCHYYWPGNIRELQNVIERAVILSTGRILRVPLTELKSRAAPSPKKHDTLEEAERKLILAALKDTDWVLSGPNGAAVRLGMKRTTLQHRMRKLGIPRRGM